MVFLKSRYNSVWSRRSDFHVLTYAEEGFAPLNEHAKGAKITKEELVAFAETVNRLNQPGSLYPKAAISALPRPIVRDYRDANVMCLSLIDFYQINVAIIRAKKILLDFRTPNVEPFVDEAIELSLRSSDVAFVDELIVLDDYATP